jgi:hypothetical protein
MIVHIWQCIKEAVGQGDTVTTRVWLHRSSFMVGLVASQQ